MKNIYKIKKELYITNDEEIKEGDWIFEIDNSTINIADKDYYRNEFDFKIILTTDHDLIKDGVQAIPDEFLEWFVKNPSCDEVEVFRHSREVGYDTLGNSYVEHSDYKIIIPKEEPKQETLEESAKDFANNSAVTNYEEGINVGKYQGFIRGAKWQQDKICNSEVLQKIRASKSDAEARRIIKTI